MRKELKIPLYSAMYDKDILNEETEKMFDLDPSIEPKLEKLKQVIVKIRDTIKLNENVHVSFGIFETFNALSEAEVKEYRGLEALKGQKSSF